MITAGYKPAWMYGGPTYSVSALSEALVKENVVTHVLTTNANGKTDLPIGRIAKDKIEGVDVTYCRRNTGDPTSVSWTHTRELMKRFRNYDVIHINGWWNWVAMVSVLVCRLYGKPFVLSPRGALSEYSFQTDRTKGIKKWLHKLIFKPLLLGSIIHVTSTEELNKTRKMIAKAEYLTIPNLIEIPRLHQHQETTDHELKLLFLGRINPIKNLELLINALHEISFKYELKIVGGGDPDYLSEIKKICNDDDRIHLSGGTFGEEKNILLAQADILVLLSHSENFGNVVVEALSQGTAVLVSEHVGASDFVRTFDLGWIIPAEIKSCVETLEYINLHRGALRVIRDKAPAIVSEQFSSCVLAKRYIQECYMQVNPALKKT